MEELLTRRGARGRGCIDLHEEWECRYWSRRFGVRPKALKAAVRQVGYKIEDVEQYLEQQKEQARASGRSRTPLRLVPCPQCGNINDIAATRCGKCSAEFPHGSGSAPAPGVPPVPPEGVAPVVVPPASAVPVGKHTVDKPEDTQAVQEAAHMPVPLAAEPRRIRPALVVTIGTVSVAVFGAVAYYYVSRHEVSTNPPALNAPAGEAQIRTRPITPPTAPARSIATAPVPGAARQAAPSPAVSGTATAPVPGAARQAAPSRAAPSPAVPTQPATTATADVCTDGVAALGLCTKRAAATGATNSPVATRTEKIRTQPPCTEATAALGLCGTSSQDRKE